MSNEHRVIHTDGDFFQVQNYVLQLLAEGKISQPAFILYTFYKSTAGFSQINYSYEFIRVNSSISKGAITKGIKQLEESGLIQVTRYGANKTFDVKIIPGANLPRRTLKQVERKGPLFDGFNNPDDNFKAAEQHKEKRGRKPELPTQSMRDDVAKKFNKAKDFDASTLSSEAIDFWNAFQEEWKRKTKSTYYPKDDMYQLTDIANYEEAKRLIPVMWVLCEHDKWTRDSDKTLSVFVHLLKIGKLNALYPKTSFYQIDRQKEKK